MPTFSVDQIGRSAVRFPSGAPIPSMTDASTDPYVRTRLPKEVQVEGVQFWPQAKAQFPGVVLLHDRWGLNNDIQDVAIRLAAQGYTVLVPNLYVRQGGMVTANAEVADALMGRINSKDLLQDINSCCEFLNTRDHVKRNVHGVVGFGMGGDLAILFACQRKRLRAAVSFYGYTGAPETLKDLSSAVLYHRAGNDDRVSASAIDALRQAAVEHKKEVTIKTYQQARPGFLDENRKEVYDAEAAREAWAATFEFLNDHLKSEP
jgi:carboxymethylenebutenolidase